MIFFPAPYSDLPLTENDFKRFSLPFSRILKEKIPTVSEILFLTKNSVLKSFFHSSEMIKCVQKVILGTDKNPDRACAHDNSFILPFPIGDETVVAVIQGVDPFLAQKADHEWLIEIRNKALQEFSQLKRERVDRDTGLLNAANLHDVLKILKDSTDVSLMLIELFPRVRSASEAILYSRNAALSLTSFADYRFPVHYLGHGIFALVTEHEEEESASHIGAMLISWLRRENFPRVHIGCSRKNAAEPATAGLSLLDEAWQALQVACRRGPFSFCHFSLLAHPEQHPLRQPSRQVLAEFSRKWKNSDLFSIVQFQSGNTESLHAYLAGSIDGAIFREDDDFYVFLEGMNSRKALAWVQRKIKDIKRKIGGDTLLSAGIGSYPLADFSKKEIPHNCRKALLHAAFFGPGSVVVFDAVSLNISGDIFFSDGDLENAVREYKKGLICDKNNINLLNSLGVTCAMMDRHRMAHQCFDRVLALDPENFMALYNLGLGEVLLGHDGLALAKFERALAVQPDGPEDLMKNDLQFQAGRLYCVSGKFQKAVDMLSLWYGNAKGAKNAGRAFRYLGKSYYGLGMKDEAMIWLQRALQFDQFDAEVMGLLGEVYLEQGEGNEIALSLCEKSVELAPRSLRLRLGLAKAQTACLKYIAARNNLRLCLKNKETKAEAQLQNGLICLKQGQKKKAAIWFTRVLVRNTVTPKIAESARYYLEVNGN